MQRILIMLYGIAAYVLLLGVFLYAVGFILGVPFLPKTIDSGAAVPLAEALLVNLSVLALFAIQHSVMARKGFKRWWTKYVPPPMERSTFVLASNAALALLLWQWRPMPAVVWSVAVPQLAVAIQAVAVLGIVIALLATFLINHFELFGLHQVVAHLREEPMPAPRFHTPALYRFVRHPLYLGFIVAFWAAPVMTLGHLLFAAGATAYIFVGIFFEERDLLTLFGDDYRRYRARVAMIVPFWRAREPAAPSAPPELAPRRG
jgi:methanethiol S-methyltransferase